MIVFTGSLTIEIYQLILGYSGLIRGREFGVDDLILNTLGGAIGYLLLELLRKFVVGILIVRKEKRGRVNV